MRTTYSAGLEGVVGGVKLDLHLKDEQEFIGKDGKTGHLQQRFQDLWKAHLKETHRSSVWQEMRLNGGAGARAQVWISLCCQQGF